MAKVGTQWVKEVLKAQGYDFEEIGQEDILAFKDNFGLVIEEKDWKDPVKVLRNKIYKRGIDGKWYYEKRSQVVNYGYEVKKADMQKGNYRFIVCAYAISNLVGRRVQPIFFRRFGTIFVVKKEYFPIWLKSIERTYLGEMSLESPSYYMGGK